MNLLVSIIIPTYNRALLIGETLDSVLAQTYQKWECILVDDGSTDTTIEILKKYSERDTRIQFYSRPKHRLKGANACRNYGFEVSNGDYIQWFDSDDLMHPEKIKQKVASLNVLKYDYVVCAGIEFKGNVSNTFNKWNNLSSDTPLISHLTGDISFHTNGPLFKRSFLENKNLFDETLQRKQEWEFYTRLLIVSSNYFAIQNELFYFRIHDISINGLNSEKTLRSRIQSCRKIVYNLKLKTNILSENRSLRKHFLKKYIYLIKLALSLKMPFNILLAIIGIIEVMSFNLFIQTILNVVRNLFSSNYKK